MQDEKYPWLAGLAATRFPTEVARRVNEQADLKLLCSTLSHLGLSLRGVRDALGGAVSHETVRKYLREISAADRALVVQATKRMTKQWIDTTLAGIRSSVISAMSEIEEK